MAQSQSQDIRDIEVLLERYYKENFSPVIQSELKQVRARQLEESRRNAGTSLATAYGDAALNPFVISSNRGGEWNRKAIDKVIENVDKRTKTNAIEKDFETLTNAWRDAVIKKIGKEKYDIYSKACASGDLAKDYFSSRLENLLYDNLAASKVPKSSIEFILKDGWHSSLTGTLLRELNPASVATEKSRKVFDRQFKNYNPNMGEKFGSLATSSVTDIITLRTPIKSAVSLAGIGIFDFGLPLASDLVGEETLEENLSRDIYGNKDGLKNVQQQAKKNARVSSNADVINSQLNKRVNVRVAYSSEAAKTLSSDLQVSSGGDAVKNLANIKKELCANGIAVKSSGVPAWMLQKNVDKLIELSSFFTSQAVAMKKAGTKHLKLNGGKVLSYEEVCQRAYDYAVAAKKVQDRNLSATRSQSSTETETEKKHVYSSVPPPTQTETTTPENQTQSVGDKTVSQWGGLFDTLGLKGFGDITGNLGYVFSILPDLLCSMFTGQSEKMKFENNLLPIASIFMGMFVSNPLLKMMFIGLGGANLLNKGVHEAMEEEGIKEPSQKALKYTALEKEALSNRVSSPEVNGDVVVMTLDGKPVCVTIDKKTAELYQQGIIPLNNLCNKIVDIYDVQGESVANTQTQSVSREEERELYRGIR